MIDIATDTNFCREVECTYKDEKYSVRDNGTATNIIFV
jgi:hypothetical protein